MSLRATSPAVAVLAAALAGAPTAAHAQPAPEPSGENAPAETAGDPDATLPIPPVPPRIAEGAQYDQCLDRLAADPSGADAIAATLAATDHEAGAHCHALAQVELGNTEEGAALLDRLAATSTAPAASRAELYAQAGQAWSMAGQANQALNSATQALTLSSDDPDLRIGHAIAAIALQHHADADADLTHALELDPKRADALILRATARRNLGQLAQAKADIDAAFQLDPDNADGLLERGILRQRTGDLAGARQDWQRAVELAADTPTGDLAQQDLALLDAGSRK